MTAEEYKELIERELGRYFGWVDTDCPVSGLADAMNYSLMAGGKRIRPMLLLEFCRISGGDIQTALPLACAVEMLHTYSLIHDDLPCMDNDDLRRGRPTNHKVYGVGTATLAGDALQAEAFGTILRSDLPARVRADCALDLADAVGLDGMCGGQYLDLTGDGLILGEDELNEINVRKTGALLIACCRMGVHAAGGSMKQLEAASQYGAAVGIAFQLRDDMLDVLSTEEELGKPIGSDRKEGKNTYVTLCGLDRCAERIAKLTRAAKEALAEGFHDTVFLDGLAESMAVRMN